MAPVQPTKDSPGVVAVQSIVEYFEQLGVCVAVFAGAAAVIRFRTNVFPIWPAIAGFVGTALLLGSLVLALLVAASWFARHTTGIAKKWVLYLLGAVVTITAAFFVIAGGYAAIASL